MPFDFSPRNTWIFLSILLFGLFPGFFFWILNLPLLPIYAVFRSPAPAPPKALVPVTHHCACSSSPSHHQASGSNMAWVQKQFALPARSRGSYLITDDVVKNLPEIATFKVGLLHLFVQHTSCALSLNENWDSDVRADMSDALDRIAPEDRKGSLYRHSAEGLDDMPAHIKSALIGASVSVPIKDGKLATGTWQGIWYLEFRAAKHTRKVVATIQGEKK